MFSVTDYGTDIEFYSNYGDETFSERICSIWWFKYFIRGRWDCLIIVNIRAEGEPIFKDWRKKAVEWFIYKEYVLYKYFVFKFENMVRFNSHKKMNRV